MTTQELDRLLAHLYDLIEHGKMEEAKNVLRGFYNQGVTKVLDETGKDLNHLLLTQDDPRDPKDR